MDILTNLTKHKKSITRSICAENFTGEKGKAAMSLEGANQAYAEGMGQGWKISPCIVIKSKSTFVLADIKDSGTINHIWMTSFPTSWRKLILRVYWDDALTPSIQSPIGDFFCNGWCERSLLSSIPMTVNPAGGFNSYFQMPFKSHARFEIENIGLDDVTLYYQIDYSIEEHEEEIMYFHAYWKRECPIETEGIYEILPRIDGTGHYVGTYLAWQVNENRWWGEGEIKFYMDGDKEFPTICGTGTEDYFGGAWNFEYPKGEYCSFSTAYQGLHQIIKPDGLYNANMRFGMYRWHIMDPIRYESDLRVTIQALGWRPGFKRYLKLKDDIASVCFFYQTKVCNTLTMNADPDHTEVI